MPAYPASLPQAPLVQGFSDQRQAGMIRSEMETGAPKTRKRFTAALRILTFPTILNGTQRATFDTFYITTINEGTDEFTIPDPVDAATITVKFKSPPEFRIVDASGTATSERQWAATYKLELKP
ncbi:MAG: hypothetical protein HOG49_19385 [Candidatus Scalindua sp.]|jgi:hypothetical protein|nr:hypothetical protein [Candidatus Scalindua sp.]